MITEWNDIDIDMFKNVFDMYWNHEEGLENKVIEIQSLTGIKRGNTDDRAFLGINIKLEDYQEWNKMQIKMIEMMNKLADTAGMPKLNDSVISMCIFENGPRIIPLGAIPEHYNLILATAFGQQAKDVSAEIIKSSKISVVQVKYWYYRTEEHKYIIGLDKSLDRKEIKAEKMVRLRTMDFEDWKEYVKDYIENDYKVPQKYKLDDIKKEDIIPVTEIKTKSVD